MSDPLSLSAAVSSGEVTDRIVAAFDRIARGVRSHRQTVAASVDLTPLQLELLRMVADGAPPRPAPGALAVEFGVSQPTVTDSLTALERKGYVERRTVPEDRRRTEVVVTDSGRRLATRAERSDDVLHAMVANLPEAERGQLLAALLGCIEGLLDAHVIQVARICPTCQFFRAPGAEGSEHDHAHCALLDAPIAPGQLQVNCAEHQSAQSA